MSELSKLLQSQPVAANPAIPANPQGEISKISNFSRRGNPKTASRLVQSVDQRSKELRESSGGALRQAAEDDWEEVSNDPAKLIAFADLLAITQIRESGGIPDSYTAITTCQNCGEVPIWPGCPPMVKECPWCLNRIKGLPVPNHEDYFTEQKK